MTDPKDLANAASKLQSSIAELTKTVEDANIAREDLIEIIVRGKRNRQYIVAQAIGFTLLAILTGVVGVLGFQLSEVVQEQKDAALCPLYSVFIQADTPQNAERARLQGQDMDERTKAFKIIRESYQALECKQNDSQ